MWPISEVWIDNRLGDLVITVGNQEKHALVASLLQRILGDKFERRPSTGTIFLIRGSFLYSYSENDGQLVYIPFSRGKSFYGLYINKGIFYLVGNASLDLLKQERGILDRISALES